MAERLVVIGGVAAGMSAAAKIRRLDRNMEIVVYEKSGYVSYGACGLPYFIKGEIEEVDALIARTPQEFAKVKIDVRLQHEVLAIDPTARTVQVRNLLSGESYTDHWDKLLLTAGSVPVKPSLPGLDLPGIFTLRQVEDGLAIRRWLKEMKPARAVIVGGGYIGLEMAEALAAHNLAVTVVELAEQLMPTIDPEMAEHIQVELKRQGVAVQLGQAVEGFQGEERVQRVVVGGQELPAELVIFSVGVKSNNRLAKAAGIALGPTGAVAVDARQQTNLPGIWAAGDVAEARHRVTGKAAHIPLGTTASKQGRVAGTNIGGGQATFAGIVGTAAVKVFDLHIALTGLSEQQAKDEGFDAASTTIKSSAQADYMPGKKPIHVKLVYEKGSQRLLGGQIVGVAGVAKRIDVIAAALQAGWTTYDLAELDMSYAPPFAPVWDPILVAANVANG